MLYSLAIENTLQRNLDAAFDNAIMYTETMAGNSMRGWKLLSLVVSAQQRFKDAEIVVELALDEAGRMDQFELLRLRAVLQIAQEQPKLAIETYRIFLSLIQAQRDLQARNPDHANVFESVVCIHYMLYHLLLITSCMIRCSSLKMSLVLVNLRKINL